MNGLAHMERRACRLGELEHLPKVEFQPAAVEQVEPACAHRLLEESLNWILFQSAVFWIEQDYPNCPTVESACWCRFPFLAFTIAREQFVDKTAHLNLVQLRQVTVTEHFLAERLDHCDVEGAALNHFEHELALLV